jgi:hypothetical protein
MLIGLDSSLRMRAANQKFAARTHSQYNKNDSSSVVRLSKIAHMGTIKVAMPATLKAEHSARLMRTCPEARGRRGARPFGCVRIGQVEFASTVEADLICAVFDGEHTAQVTVSATENKLEHGQQQFHKSPARWRRSQLPFASSHSSRERTLARARAIAQSAAP